MYIAGLVIPAPEEKMEAYRKWAEASSYAAEAKMHQDERMDAAGEPPFDAKRLILGCFEPIFSMGRG